MQCSKALAVGILASMAFFCSATYASAQQARMTRLAKLVIDSVQLEGYNRLLKEEIETSIRVEPGVLTLYAVADKANPTHITILEIYADSAAYRSHLTTPHFLKYKAGTAAMVKQLELVAVTPLVADMKIK